MSLKKLNKLKGFTLIELMIVVAIIGILAAIAIPKFADLVTKSKEAAVKGNIGSVRSAMSIYYGDTEGVNPINGSLYNALTFGSKYVGAQAGLGDFSIPKSANMTVAHTGGRVTDDSKITYTAVSGDTADGTPLAYDSNLGVVWVDCSHQDSKGSIWSGY